MESHKNQPEIGMTHGLIWAGGGFTHYINRIVDHYFRYIMSPQGVRLRASWSAHDPEVADMFLNDDHDSIQQKIVSLLYGCDDDVVEWDKMQFPISFTLCDLRVISFYNIDLTRITAHQVQFLMLLLVSNCLRCTRLACVYDKNRDTYTVVRLVRILASGELLTAHYGSNCHIQITIERATKLYKLVSSIDYDTVSPLLRFLVDFALVSVVVMTHSDDKTAVIPVYSIPFDSLLDPVYHYTKHNLVLIPEPTYTPAPSDPFGLKINDFLHFVDSTLAERYGCFLGKSTGVPYQTPALIRPVTLFDPDTRYRRSYKPLFTTIGPLGEILVKGIEFLRFNFLNLGSYDIGIRRTPERLIAKFIHLNNSELNSAEWILRLRSYMYLSVNNEPLYQAFAGIEADFRSLRGITSSVIASELLQSSNKDLVNLRYMITGIDSGALAETPTYKSIVRFFLLESDPSMSVRYKLLKHNSVRLSFDPTVRPGEPRSSEPIRYLPVKMTSSLRLKVLELRAAGKLPARHSGTTSPV